MGNMGFTRRVDELGRIVLPMEIRRALGINEKDALDISMDKDAIILKKHQKTCVFCGAEIAEHTYMEKVICKKCSQSLKKLT
ncbi:MAG: AbrB/MazE/SpoVT family DNA-binding domain-containing protein [Oscillospiraceae bacterium]|nr:AbrB/MazE/SpoVT family DNA-binding domain-containing protein [Oscillospiraceae bacterium]